MSARTFLLAPLVLAACADVTLSRTNDPPVAIIQLPVDGATFGEGEPVTLRGKVADDGPVTEVEVSWLDDGALLVGDLAPDRDGVVSFTTSSLARGPHAITLRAVDPTNLSHEVSIALTITASDDKPRLKVVRPANGERADQDVPFSFEAEVSDPQDEPDELVVEITSDLDGFVCLMDVDTDGVALCRASLRTQGDHRLTFTVTDTDGHTVSRPVILPVEPVAQEPSVVVVAPQLGAFLRRDRDLVFEATVADRQQPAHTLDVTLASDVDGALCDLSVEPSGRATCLARLTTNGRHRLTFTAVDRDANEGRAVVSVQVSDGLDVDDDGDGYCEQGPCIDGSSPGDCDDGNRLVHPGATELPNGVDDDCDGLRDEGTERYDDDGDGFCEALTCTVQADGSQALGGDCNDADRFVYPGAPETCDGRDNDCDTRVDPPGSVGCVEYWRDADRDGFGVTGDSQCLCATSGAYTALFDGDCDDTNFAINPAAPEVADAIDNNCDGRRDEGTTLYDDDGDGYCEAVTCTRQADGRQPLGGDCNDANPNVHPGMPEICNNGVDDNCNSQQNEGEDNPGCTDLWRDLDGDGFGTGSSRCLCSTGGEWSATKGGDCYDSNASVKPGQTGWFGVHRGDGSFDYDCDGAEARRWTGTYECACYMRWIIIPIELWPFEAGWASEPGCGGTGTWYTSCRYATEALDPDNVIAVCNPASAEIKNTEVRTQQCH